MIPFPPDMRSRNSRVDGTPNRKAAVRRSHLLIHMQMAAPPTCAVRMNAFGYHLMKASFTTN
ncbi:MAG: hypothetical protein R6V01_11230 [Thermoplasmatota archaeon]